MWVLCLGEVVKWHHEVLLREVVEQCYEVLSMGTCGCRSLGQVVEQYYEVLSMGICGCCV